MKNIVYVYLLIIFQILVFVQTPIAQGVIEPLLTLEECLNRALENNPRLTPYQWESRVQDGLIEQAQVRPNPTLNFEAENILGSGEFQTFNGTEVTLGASQLIETGGKRFKRTQVAVKEKELADWAYEVVQLDILQETKVAFIELLAAQERVKLQQEFYGIADRLYQTIQTSVEAGRDSPIEEIRAKVMVESTQIELGRALQERDTALKTLSVLLGEEVPSFSIVTGEILELPQVPDLSTQLQRAQNLPDLSMAQSEIERTQTALELEQAQASPDVEIGGGIRYLSESDDGAFVVGVSVPLPLFNRNQGAIRAARESVQKAEAEKYAQTASLSALVHTAFLTLTRAKQEAETLQERILPSAQQAFELTQEGYRVGKFPYLNVLDAQRSLFEIHLQLINAAEEYHKAFNRIQRLTSGYGIKSIRN